MKRENPFKKPYAAAAFFLPLIIFISVSLKIKASGPEVTHLRTEHKTNPMGIDADPPRLSWQILSGERGVMQTAWQVQSAATETDLEKDRVVWDPGKVVSGQSNLVAYGGPPLQSGERVYWRVRVWDNRGNTSDWSQPAFFEAGLLNHSDWKAKWIEPVLPEMEGGLQPCPYLRREFTLGKEICEAHLYVTCHGLYEIHMNGQKISDDLFTPGWTSYNKRLQYQAYDITGMVKKGANAVGAILGEGWYCGPFGWEGKRQLYGQRPALLLQMKITFTDGSEQWILSDQSWKTGSGPILKSEIYDGEIFDARLEKEGWDLPGFRDQGWTNCREKDYGYDNIVSGEGVPVRITGTLSPVREFITPAGERVFDMGQNMVGWVKFRLKGEKGSEIILQHAEVLDKEGNFYTANLRSAKQEIRYTFRGEGTETYEPHFTFQGFRYVKISGYTGEISLDELEGKVIHSDMEPAGDFHCSDSLLNRLQRNIRWGLRGNFLDVPTDCPQRDERMGWTGDAEVFAPTACFNMNTAAFFTKWLRDLAADQRDDGSVPWVVPMVVEGGGGTGWSDGYGATGWADAAVIVPWTLYQYFGDLRILETQYASMKAWVEYMIRHSGQRYIFDYGFHFGDWLSFAEYYSLKYAAPDYGFAGAHTDKDLIATAYFFHSAGLLQKTASLLGKEEDAARYSDLLPKIREAFQKEFMTPTGRLSSSTQTAYALALEFGLLPEEMRGPDAGRLAANVEEFGHLTTGFLGTPLLCHALSDNGYPGLAYYLLFQDKYPSWLYPVTIGATTIWERWDGIRPDSTFQDAGMNSFNHYAYGAIGDWIYRNVAGIRNDPDYPGFKRFTIRPLVTSRLDHVRAWHVSPYGRIISEWNTNGEKLQMNVTVPPNSVARIYIPRRDGTGVLESGLSLEKADGILGMEEQEDLLMLEVGSGEYHFESKKPD
jgi:alpha-L-rhamnosidase